MRVVKTIILFLILLPQLSKAQIISTIAGTSTTGYNGDGIPATTAQLNLPHGIIVDTAGNIYIAEEANNRIRKISVTTGIISTFAGTGIGGFNGDGILATSAQINGPFGLTFDLYGNLFFADRNNNRVRKITLSTGVITTVAGTGTGGYNGDGILATSAQLLAPINVEMDATGNLLIADWNNNRVRKVNSNTGIISTIAGTGTSGYNGDGIPATTANIGSPFGITIDNLGNIYIAEWGGHRIRKITLSSGIISTIAGTGTAGYNGDGISSTTAQLYGPSFIRFDNAGNMYIGDAFNHRVRKITVGTNIISTIAGTGVGGYNGDGIAANTAQLFLPYGIYFDKNCNLLIGDRSNSRVRKITGGFTGCTIAVAPGNLISCQVLPAVTIDNTNYNSWVPIYDSAGRIAAEINANGNSLGIVNTSLYTKNGPCREDYMYRLYLNRNITITPQSQPSSPVSLRLYIRKSELDSIKTALNSQNQPSGVASVNEIEVFKNNDNCLTVGGLLANRQTSTNSVYGADYYLQLSISSFSSFYFANKILAVILPVQLFSFSGTHQSNTNLLHWKATCYDNTEFTIQRSSNGIDFINVGMVNGTGADINKYFDYTDNNAGENKWYYRLKIAESSLAAKFSQTIVLGGKISNGLNIEVIPNRVTNGRTEIQINTTQSGKSNLFLMDMQGKLIEKQYLMLQNGLNITAIDVSRYGNGMYQLIIQTDKGSKVVCKFVKIN